MYFVVMLFIKKIEGPPTAHYQLMNPPLQNEKKLQRSSDTDIRVTPFGYCKSRLRALKVAPLNYTGLALRSTSLREEGGSQFFLVCWVVKTLR